MVGSRRSWRGAVAALLIALLGVLLVACGNSPAQRPAAGPDARERKAIHDGLDVIGRACKARRGNAPDALAAARQTRALLRFRRRYPTQRFILERESGTMLAVLLVARAELRGCSAQSVAAIDRVLPAEIRNALPAAR